MEERTNTNRGSREELCAMTMSRVGEGGGGGGGGGEKGKLWRGRGSTGGGGWEREGFEMFFQPVVGGAPHKIMRGRRRELGEHKFLCKTNKLSHAYFFLIFRSHAMTDVGHIRYCTSHKTGVIWRTVGATIFYEIEASVHNIAFGQVTAYLVHRTYGKNWSINQELKDQFYSRHVSCTSTMLIVLGATTKFGFWTGHQMVKWILMYNTVAPCFFL